MAHRGPDSSSLTRSFNEHSRVRALTAGALAGLILIGSAGAFYAKTQSSDPTIVGAVPAELASLASVTEPATAAETSAAPASNAAGSNAAGSNGVAGNAAAETPPRVLTVSSPIVAPIIKTLADETPSLWEVADVALNIRRDPGIAGEIIGALDRTATQIRSTGKRVAVDGVEWKQINFGSSSIGWVSARHLVADIPAPVALADEAPALWRVEGTKQQLNVRQNPGTSSRVVATLPNGTRAVAATGKRVSVDGVEWKQITHNNALAWVAARYLVVDNKAIEPAPTPIDAAVETVTVDAVAPDLATSTELAEEYTGYWQVVGVQKMLNVRVEAGAGGEIVATMAKDARGITLTGETITVGGVVWVQVSFGAELDITTGWVAVKFLEHDTTTPVSEAAETK